MQLKPCKHLDHEGEYVNCELKDLPDDICQVKFWRRTEVPYKGAPVDVQFCKLRGRMNGIFICYTGEMPCYEPE